jgi:hypothetical protein
MSKLTKRVVDAAEVRAREYPPSRFIHMDRRVRRLFGGQQRSDTIAQVPFAERCAEGGQHCNSELLTEFLNGRHLGASAGTKQQELAVECLSCERLHNFDGFDPACR